MLLLEHTDGVKGKSICEVGAGDFLTSGISMLAAGAERYAVIDRFPGDYSGATARKMYQTVFDNWNKHFPAIEWNSSIDPLGFPDDQPGRVQLIGEGIETARTREMFDLVCSFQVGEHDSDIHGFA